MRRRLVTLVGAPVLGMLLLVVSITGPSAGWFGGGTASASRGKAEVALTFDDGLNGFDTLDIATVLESHGTRGTFFIVGSTLEGQAGLARRLRDSGHLLANHSFNHLHPSPLDIRYAEVPRTQAAFRDAIGVCPRFYRAPYGDRTPWVNAAVHRAGMTMAGWDVSAKDWSETDPHALAERVLGRVKPGSIVVFHDGSEGVVGLDRSVLTAALPEILNGLRARGLQPVTLDKLLGTTGYLDRCP